MIDIEDYLELATVAQQCQEIELCINNWELYDDLSTVLSDLKKTQGEIVKIIPQLKRLKDEEELGMAHLAAN